MNTKSDEITSSVSNEIINNGIINNNLKLITIPIAFEYKALSEKHYAFPYSFETDHQITQQCYQEISH